MLSVVKRLSLLSLVLATACTVRPRDRVVQAADVGDPAKTRITAFLSAPHRPGQPTENPWGKIPRAAVQDEAWLVKLDDKEACVHFVARTHSGLDRPLADWLVTVNGALATPKNETITIVDWSPEGARVVVAEALTPEAAAPYQTQVPAPGAFRVHERSADVCGAYKRDGNVRLDLVLQPEDGRGNWGQVFEWKVK